MFVAVVIRYAKRMRRIILSSVACLAYHIFADYLINGQDFLQNIFIEHKMCVDFLYNFV